MNVILNERFVALAADAALKGILLLGVTELVLWLWRGATAATRHAARLAAMVCVLALPIANLWMPAVRRPVWAVGGERVSGNQISLTLQLRPAENRNEVSRKVPEQIQKASASDLAPKEHAIRFGSFGARWLLWVWAFDAALGLVPFVAGPSQRRVFTRGASVAVGARWEELLTETKQALRLRRPVRLLLSRHAVIPITWGWIRPVVLLPSEAEAWSAPAKRVTLAHELAHVKRWDCLTQWMAQLVCALYWFNPLAWLCARAMRLDREEACDDLVLSHHGRASDYASHLVEIASTLRGARLFTGIPMARPSQLERWVCSLLAPGRARGVPGVATRIAIGAVGLGMLAGVAAQKVERSTKENPLRAAQSEQLKKFSAEKERQAESLVALNHEKFAPEFRKFFAAAKAGEWQVVTNMYESFKNRHEQYRHSPGDLPHTPYWQTVLEVCLAYTDVNWGEPEHVQMAIDGFMKRIPEGAVYFGGTDPGRGFPTAFSSNQAEGKPFFTLSQNPLADATYLDYARAMYGEKLALPTPEDSAAAFRDYIADATARYHAGQLKPGENVTITDNRTSVSGRVAVMAINARLAKVIFDRNPDKEFYLEESFPLDWMYPHLSPAGQVMKINREPLTAIPDEAVQRDIAYWNERLKRFLGTTVKEGLSLREFAALIEQIYVKHNLPPGADPKFFENDWAQRAFSKWRCAIAGLYAWRARNTADATERERMSRAAELAFRQTCALMPTSPEAISAYVDFLKGRTQFTEAQELLKVVLQIEGSGDALRELEKNLEVKVPAPGAGVWPGESIEPPREKGDAAAEPTRPAKIKIARNGEVFWNGKKLSIVDLEAKCAALKRAGGSAVLYIDVDGGVLNLSQREVFQKLSDFGNPLRAVKNESEL